MATIGLWLAIWWVPLLSISRFGADTILADIGWFFSKLAVVTFGGAYAVLAYMAQDVVNAQGWLTAGAMMDGLGLAETTPGPLILVTEFVGFLSAFGAGGLAPGLAGAVVAARYLPPRAPDSPRRAEATAGLGYLGVSLLVNSSWPIALLLPALVVMIRWRATQVQTGRRQPPSRPESG